MGKLLPNTIDERMSGMNHSQIDLLFSQYRERRDGQASVEGLESIAGNIAIAFGDFIIRTAGNITTIASKSFKDVKRSTLQVLVNANSLGMARAAKGDYSGLKDIRCNAYPFTISPNDVSVYCQESFELISMEKRIVNIIEAYMHLAASISIGDSNKALALLKTIEDFNLTKRLDVVKELTEMISTDSRNQSVAFGTIFDSTSDWHEAVKSTLASANELNSATVVSRNLEHLYKAYDKLKDAIVKASETAFDMSQLGGIATTIHQTGSLIEQYAMLVKEYHHLEWWMTTTTTAVLQAMKK